MPRRIRPWVLVIVAACLMAWPAAVFPVGHTDARTVHVITIDGVIDQTASGYLASRIREAESAGVEALVLRLDTPGGLDTSMRRMVKDILAARIPVIVFVAPSGSRAASAGVFITYAAHVAAMAPGTNIGAAHPVNLGGDLPPEISEKAANDAAAFLRSLARLRDRDEGFAREAVLKSSSLTADEALEKGVIDLTAADLDTLLDRLDGRRVTVDGETVTLQTRGAAVAEKEMSFRQRLLHALTNPNLAYLFMIIGFYGLIYELANPGVGFSGIGGAIGLIIGLYSLHVIGVNYAGLTLVVLAFALFLADLFMPTHGILTAGGIAALLFGSLLLVDTDEGLAVSLLVIVPVTLATVLFSSLAVGAGLRAQRRAVVTGSEAMIGLTGRTRSLLDPEGLVSVHGELWRAVSIRGTIPEGTMIRVVGVDGLRLTVEILVSSESETKKEE